MQQKPERIAGGGLVSIVGGFFIAVALTTKSPTRRSVIPTLVWLVTVICTGLVVTDTDTRHTKRPAFWRLRDAALPALVLSATPVVYLCFILVIKLTDDLVSGISWKQLVLQNLNLSYIAVVLGLWVVAFIASLVIIIMSMVASELVLAGAQMLYEFGPQGVNRVKLIVLGIGGVLVATLSLLPILGISIP